MSRRNKSYLQGMKDGIAPFGNKLKQTAIRIEQVSGSLNNVIKNQHEAQEITTQLIDEQQKIGENLTKTTADVKKQEKVLSKNIKKLENLELIMPSFSVVCDGCGKPLGVHQLVCSYCGRVSKSFPYELTDFNIQDECILSVDGLTQTIKDSQTKEENWLYSELNEKFIKMKKIQNISEEAMKQKETENVPAYKKIHELSQKFFSDYEKKRIEIAVVGTVKAGKSSLINALIGTKLASVDATPETSILVKYHTTKESNYLKITFYTESEWNSLWQTTENATVFRKDYKDLQADKEKSKYLNHEEKYVSCTAEKLPSEMMKWSSSKEPKHFFVKEIEVGYQSETFPHDVFLVDTPGLSDPVRYRSDITRKYIKNADWILACISGENLSGQPEFNFLSKVISNKGGDEEADKIFVVATKKDMLLTEEGNKKAKEFLVRLGKLYNNKSLAISRFSFVSAETHLLTSQVLRGIKLDNQDTKKLRKALLEIGDGLEFSDINLKSDEILKYAGINDLFHKIDEFVLQNRRTYIIGMILEDYAKCMRVINDNASIHLKDVEQLLKDLTEHREYEQSQIEELTQDNSDLEDLIFKAQEVCNRLQREVKVSADLNKNYEEL